MRIDVNDPTQFPTMPTSGEGSPPPWMAHPDAEGWHLAKAGARPGHDHSACVAVFFREGDAELVAELVTKFAARDPSPLSREYAISPMPWRVRLEEDPTDPSLGPAWHLYTEVEGRHQCVATFHHELDAKLTLIVVNGVALLDRERQQHGS